MIRVLSTQSCWMWEDTGLPGNYIPEPLGPLPTHYRQSEWPYCGSCRQPTSECGCSDNDTKRRHVGAQLLESKRTRKRKSSHICNRYAMPHDCLCECVCVWVYKAWSNALLFSRLIKTRIICHLHSRTPVHRPVTCIPTQGYTLGVPRYAKQGFSYQENCCKITRYMYECDKHP